MREKGIYKLKVDPEFRSLISPLRKKELIQLEENLLADGCIDPIVVWNDIIVDGHNRYTICTRHSIPFHVVDMLFECREEAIAWICAHQLGRRNISEETRKYLIGTQYHASKIADRMKNATGSNQFSEPESDKRLYIPDPLVKGPSGHVTAKAVADENHISVGTVQKYANYAKAIEAIGQKAPEIVVDILAGKYKISYLNTIELAKQTPAQIRSMISRVSENTDGFVHYKKMRSEIEQMPKEEPQAPPQQPAQPVRSIKDMPAFDPDAEIIALSLTIPSWIGSMKRAWTATDQALISANARVRVSNELVRLRSQINSLLRQLKEK